MSQPFVGEIRIFAGNFAPAGWMFCAGQLLPISENDTLFNLIGTTYGGDGQSTASPLCAVPLQRARELSRRVARPDRQLPWLVSTANRLAMGPGACTRSITADSATRALIRSTAAGVSRSPLRAKRRARLPPLFRQPPPR